MEPTESAQSRRAPGRTSSAGAPGRPRSYDPSVDDAILLGVGSAHGVTSQDEPSDPAVGRLLIPDPEQRSGWREFYVRKPGAEKPGHRPIGFGR